MKWADIKKKIKEELKEASVTAGNTKFNLITGVNKNDTKLGVKVQFEPQSMVLKPETKSKLEVALQTKLNAALGEYGMQVSKDTDIPKDRPGVIGFFIPIKQIKNLIVKGLTGDKVEEASVMAPEPEDAKTEGNAYIDAMRKAKEAGKDEFEFDGETHPVKEYQLNEVLTSEESEGLKDELSSKIAGIVKTYTSGMEINNADLSKIRDMRQEINMEINASVDHATDPNSVKNELNEELLKEMRVRDLNEASKIVNKDDFYAFINAGNNIIRDMEVADKSKSEAKKYLAYLVKHNIM
jgi:hypothetical protein|tara:strand:- start:559 stop:1446 length:888 start_codon:yes stop_codon:yes gene_type:complete